MADSGSRPDRLWTPDRRQFLRAVGVAGMGAAIAACSSEPGGGGPGGGEEAAGQAVRRLVRERSFGALGGAALHLPVHAVRVDSSAASADAGPE